MDEMRPTALLDVTALPPLGEVLDLLPELLAAWMPAQRWYAHKGAGTPTIAIDGWATLRVAPDHVVVLVVAAVRLEHGAEALYQVPLVLRRPDAPSPAREEGAEVGVLAVPGGPLRVDDAARDADGRAALIATLVSGDGAAGPGLSLASHRTAPDAPLPLGRAMRSRILSGEQSNTSLIVETEGASPLIVKLFRVLQDGENPDVVLQGALTRQGSTRVPAVVGSATVRTAGLRTHGLFAQEFLPGVEDAWRVALRLALAGEDFTEAARHLGSTLAEVHRDLTAALGTVAADEQMVSGMLAQMRRRVEEVAAEVPQVAAHREHLESLLDAAAGVPWPAMQRIHGDLHLGQVLLVPERGWVLLDFEGEPLRPLAERALPDSPLRDVAGMLRSLDYVAGAVALEHGADAAQWTAAVRAAFLEGWSGGAGTEGTPADGAGVPEATAVLLAAFEADKAVYEALYEARNRPGWLPIPLGALERLSAPGLSAPGGAAASAD
ncbi:phosphotransferase [Brachybacterium aquaticum]|uniref:Maltokinase n=1 Tax=Brachybacterium aquaticum TaxID=1432564 RepID=A0A841AB96_9MICO|nr:phosphotransferase [Brachybacterium aquaticum]MBB5830388.1 trehalose synthase-fused probable maltokinase [Brachybacterium aquaticum]